MAGSAGPLVLDEVLVGLQEWSLDVFDVAWSESGDFASSCCCSVPVMACWRTRWSVVLVASGIGSDGGHVGRSPVALVQVGASGSGFVGSCI